jgi:hypothetical protein
MKLRRHFDGVSVAPNRRACLKIPESSKRTPDDDLRENLVVLERRGEDRRPGQIPL